MELPQIDDYRALLLNDVPLLDVRAPIEFNQGAFPMAKNFPLINDQERADIGLCYKQQGQEQAITLGHQLVQGEIKKQRVNDWENFFQQHPQGVLYCFRGGMRSKISQQWIYERTGVIYSRIKGGYKALRRFLINELEISADIIHPIMLGGRTGSGKTLLLQKLKHKIDLENIYNHRGSVFGKHATPQPTQINIENKLAIELIKFLNKQQTRIVFEDEASNIGSRNIPDILSNKLKQSPIVLLQASIDERISIIFQEYIIEALAEHQSHYGEEEGFNSWANYLHNAIDKIQRRLGGARYKELKTILTEAIRQQQLTDNKEQHRQWIKKLLIEYYDPMYDYQINRKEDRIVYKGQWQDVFEYLSQNSM